MATAAKSGDVDNESARKAYILPSSRQEIERMKNQHEWIKASFGGLIKAPIDYQKKNQKILDSAAADGIAINCVWYLSFAHTTLGTWLCEVSTLFPPETELVGFDIASVYRCFKT